MHRSLQPRRRWRRSTSTSVSAVVWLVTLLIASLPTHRASAAPGDVRVMSFNIRTANAADGVNDWDGNRKNLVEQTIRNYGPDLVGFQEDLKRQRDFLADQFPAYEFVGRGSQGGNDGPYDTVMYRR